MSWEHDIPCDFNHGRECIARIPQACICKASRSFEKQLERVGNAIRETGAAIDRALAANAEVRSALEAIPKMELPRARRSKRAMASELPRRTE